MYGFARNIHAGFANGPLVKYALINIHINIILTLILIIEDTSNSYLLNEVIACKPVIAYRIIH